MYRKALNYLRHFRLVWDAKHLRSSDVLSSEKFSVQQGNQVGTAFLLESRLPAGWYMLEWQIKSGVLRTNGQVSLIGGGRKNTQYFGFPLHSGRMSKRLIHLSSAGQLNFDLPLAQGNFELQYFRLVRVTQKFARSRMLRKLQMSHPRYRMQKNSPQLGVKPADLAKTADLSTLWKDYNLLFDANAELAPYREWIREFDTLTDAARVEMLRHAEQFSRKPLISIVMPVYNPNPVWLQEAVESVRNQIYANWELCIADDASPDPAIRSILEKFAQEDKRIKVVFREKNGHISAASNSALAIATGEWIALLDHDDLLPEHALFWVVDAINQHPDTRLIYSDEDKVDEAGKRSVPYFKCDWNQDLFYSQNMFCHFGVYHSALVHEVGGFRLGLEGLQDYDLVLRCIEKIVPTQIFHIPRILYHWRIHENSTAHEMEAKPYAMIAGENALNEHFERLAVNAKAEFVGHGYRVRYALPDKLPLVSLIIPTRNGLKLLRQCVKSILSKTIYSNYEILIVDNGSDDPATLRYMQEIASGSRIRVIRDDRPFNYSALNNAAVKLARGEVVGLINNDVEVISPDWLSEMVSHALRPEVGAVGARLWYSDDTIQHAGVVLGVHGIAGHVHRFLPKGDTGYCGRAVLIQSFSAVTGACLLVRKSIYEAVGGLNETELQVACNDVDFCLRLREAGYRNIWIPYAELYHHESATRGFDDTPEKLARSAKEIAYMQQRWSDLLQNDPAYSPNLSLDDENFSLAWPPRVGTVFDCLSASPLNKPI